jgi:hypothetical protein
MCDGSLVETLGVGGHQISTDLGSAYRHGSHAQIFFLRAKLLIYFLEIKEFKARATDFLNPINGRAAAHAEIGLFISHGPRAAVSQSKKRREIQGGGVGMRAHHDC